MRYLDKCIIKDLKTHMVLLSGPRQCGKTTFSKWLLENEDMGEYFNWDQIKDRKKIIKQEWNENSKLLVLDEIHKKKYWKTFLKGIYDTKPKTMQMLVTGSARLELFQKSGDSMFGRFHGWRMHPFCLREDPLRLSLQERFSRMMERGGFPYPYLVKNMDDVHRWRTQRWSLLLREDLRDLERIHDIQKIELLAELLKSCAGNLVSFSNLAEDVEIAPKTAKIWTHVLEKLYLVFMLTPYTGTLKRSLSKTPKIYFMDMGDLVDQPEGSRIENLVAINLLKRIHYLEDYYGDRVSLHYIRDKEGREVDFVITKNRRVVALIEVKKSFQAPDASLLYFKKRLNPEVAIQLHTEINRSVFVKKGVQMIAVQKFFDQPIHTRKFW